MILGIYSNVTPQLQSRNGWSNNKAVNNPVLFGLKKALATNVNSEVLNKINVKLLMATILKLSSEGRKFKARVHNYIGKCQKEAIKEGLTLYLDSIKLRTGLTKYDKKGNIIAGFGHSKAPNTYSLNDSHNTYTISGKGEHIIVVSKKTREKNLNRKIRKIFDTLLSD